MNFLRKNKKIVLTVCVVLVIAIIASYIMNNKEKFSDINLKEASIGVPHVDDLSYAKRYDLTSNQFTEGVYDVLANHIENKPIVPPRYSPNQKNYIKTPVFPSNVPEDPILFGSI